MAWCFYKAVPANPEIVAREGARFGGGGRRGRSGGGGHGSAATRDVRSYGSGQRPVYSCGGGGGGGLGSYKRR